MGMSGGKQRGSLNAEINVTPMVDVMLVLLVIFMITTTTMANETAVDLDLPETNAAVMEDPQGRLTLSIDRNRGLYLGKTRVKWLELEEKLLANERVQKEKELYIEADQNLPYNVVVTAMAAAQNAGVIKLQMRTASNAQIDYSLLDEHSEKTDKSKGSSKPKK